MARYIRRHRVLSIRLSDDEYEQLEHLCDSIGVESISELTRSALRLLVQQEKNNGKPGTESQVREMRARLSLLDREVARLANHVGLNRLEDRP